MTGTVHVAHAGRGDAPGLAVNGVTVRIGGISALSDVSFDVGQGELLGIIGPNGAGKTTLFDVISGFRKSSAGTIHIGGADATDRTPLWRARHGLRRTFQRQQVIGTLSVEENLLLAQEWRGGGGGMLADAVALPARRHRERDRRQRVREVMALCGLEGLAAVPAGVLPIGQARMLEFGRAIVDGARVLLLDEPTSGVSEAEAEKLTGAIELVRKEEGCSVLLVEHDVGLVMRVATRVLVLNLGSVLAIGPPAEVRANEAVQSSYLG